MTPIGQWQAGAAPISVTAMTKSSRRLRWYGGLGLVAGVLLIVAAPLAGAGISDLVRGYGTMLALSAAYLLAGEWLLALGRSRRGQAQTRGAVLIRR